MYGRCDDAPQRRTKGYIPMSEASLTNKIAKFPFLTNSTAAFQLVTTYEIEPISSRLHTLQPSTPPQAYPAGVSDQLSSLCLHGFASSCHTPINNLAKLASICTNNLLLRLGTVGSSLLSFKQAFANGVQGCRRRLLGGRWSSKASAVKHLSALCLNGCDLSPNLKRITR